MFFISQAYEFIISRIEMESRVLESNINSGAIKLDFYNSIKTYVIEQLIVLFKTLHKSIPKKATFRHFHRGTFIKMFKKITNLCEQNGSN